jgi:hypothetical protein
VITPRRVVLTLITAAALFAFVFAFTLGDDSPSPADRDDAVEFLHPPPGTPLEVRQAQVGIDLAPGWTGVLSIEVPGRPPLQIPEEELNRVEPLNQFFFQPGPGRVFEEFPPGRLCAIAEIWRSVEGRGDSRQVRWCFRLA